MNRTFKYLFPLVWLVCFVYFVVPLFGAVGQKDVSFAGTNAVLSGASLGFNSGSTFTYSAGASFSGDAAEFRADIGAGTSSFDGAFGSLTGKPTTLSGYGITDGVTASSLSSQLSALSSVYQPLDSDLTSIAALATTSFGRGLLAESSASTLKTSLSLGNVDNTSDANKPVSTATRTAIDQFARAPRPGIVSVGTSYIGLTDAGGSSIQVGLGDRTQIYWLRAADFTPGATFYIATKFASNLGSKLMVLSTGIVRLEYGNGSNFSTYRFDSTAALGATDGAWIMLAVTEDRDGNATFYLNGAQLGNPVSIAAASAQTLTSTGALLWGSDGTTHFAGTYGESQWIAGLLSASRIADIYRAGSIAPFCAYTPNTTTGQNTATIDGLSFFTWPDFGRADPINNPIAWDRSGNNQHAILGTSGLTAAVPLVWRNTAPTHAFVGDGSATGRVHNTLNSQNPGTGEFFLRWEGIYPQDATSTSKILAALTSSLTTTEQGKAAVLQYESVNGPTFRLYGATTSDYRQIASTALHTHLAALGARGIWTALVARRDSSGVRIFLGIGRDTSRFADVTNLFTTSTSGTAPAWTDEVDGDYYVGFYRNSTNSSAHPLARFDLANVAMTEAQLRAEDERGEPGPEWVGGSNTPVYTSNFATTDGFDHVGATLTANYDSGDPGYSSVLRIVSNDGSSDRAQRAVSSSGTTQVRKAFRVRFDYKRVVGSTQTFLPTNFNVTEPGTPIPLTGPLGEWTTLTTTFVSTAGVRILFYAAGNSGGGAAGDELLIANVVVERIGYTTRLRTDTAAGLTALNAAKSATNDSTDFLLSTSGITHSPSGPRTQVIRFSTTTNGNQQIAGASVIDTNKKWRIRSWTITCASGTPSISLGNASAGTQYASSVSLATGLNDITPATRLPATANLWCASNSTAQLDHVVTLDLAE